MNVEHPEALITQLTQLFNKDWEEEERILAFLTSIDQVKKTLDWLYILATSFHKPNSTDPRDFVFSTQLDLKEPEIYEQAMSGSYTQQWFYAIQEEMDQIKKNKMWELVLISEIENGYKPLSSK